MKSEHDGVLIALLVALFIDALLFTLTSGIRLPLLDVSVQWSSSGFTITFTGIAEIIVAIGFAIGAVIRAKSEKFNPSKR